MAMTLQKSLEYSTDELQRGVVQTIATESKLLAILPFMNIEGAAYSYNIETAGAEVGFRAVNEAYNTKSPELQRMTESLRLLGGEAVLDSYIERMILNVNDVMAIETSNVAKAISYKFETTFLHGNTADNPLAFDGLYRKVLPDNTVHASNRLADDMDILADMVTGKPSAFIMNKSTRRKLTREARQNVTYGFNDFGKQQMIYDGVPVIDLDDQLMPATGDVFAVTFGEETGVCGLQSQNGIRVKPLGELGYTPQLKTRIEWFVGMAIFNPKAIALRKA